MPHIQEISMFQMQEKSLKPLILKHWISCKYTLALHHWNWKPSCYCFQNIRQALRAASKSRNHNSLWQTDYYCLRFLMRCPDSLCIAISQLNIKCDKTKPCYLTKPNLDLNPVLKPLVSSVGYFHWNPTLKISPF